MPHSETEPNSTQLNSIVGQCDWGNPFQARPFECAEFLIFAVRVHPRDHVSEIILEKDPLEAEISPS